MENSGDNSSAMHKFINYVKTKPIRSVLIFVFIVLPILSAIFGTNSKKEKVTETNTSTSSTAENKEKTAEANVSNSNNQENKEKTVGASAQNQSPMNGFPDAQQAVIEILEKNPQVIKQLIESENPNDIAMCTAVGMFASVNMIQNSKDFKEGEIKVQAFNAALMMKAHAQLNPNEKYADSSLKNYVGMLKQQGVGAFNNMWPICDEINSKITPLIRQEFKSYVLRPLIK